MSYKEPPYGNQGNNIQLLFFPSIKKKGKVILCYSVKNYKTNAQLILERQSTDRHSSLFSDVRIFQRQFGCFGCFRDSFSAMWSMEMRPYSCFHWLGYSRGPWLSLPIFKAFALILLDVNLSLMFQSYVRQTLMTHLILQAITKYQETFKHFGLVSLHHK